MLSEMLREVGWSKRELARRLGVRANTVSDWGEDPPGYALALLRVALARRLEWELLGIWLRRGGG